MNTMPFADQVAQVWQVAVSKTLLWFYAPLLAVIAVVSIVVGR